MQSSTGQYSTQAGDPAQPVQHSVMTASSFGFFLRGVVRPFERGSCFSSSGTIPGAFAASDPVGIELNYIVALGFCKVPSGLIRAPQTSGPATSAPEARSVIRHAEGEQDEQEEDRAHNHQAGQFLVRVLHMHVEEHDQGGFDGCDGEGDDSIERTEVDEGGSHGEGGAREQGHPDREARTKRRNVFGSLFGRRFGSGIVLRHGYLTYAFLTYDGRSGRATRISKSRQYRQSASTGQRFRWACSTWACICPARPCRQGIRTGRRR